MDRKEAIEVVKERLDYYESEKRFRAACETLIPELAESEDEKIRKWLYDYIERVGRTWGKQPFHYEQILAYLEKQKECVADSSKTSASEDERIRKYIINFVNLEKGVNLPPDDADRMLAYLEKQKESTWTEEDERFRKHILPRILNPTSWTLEQVEADRGLLKEFVERQKSKWTEKQKEPNAKSPSSFGDDATIAYHFGLDEGARREREKQKEQKPEECIPDSVKFDEGFKTGREIGFREGVESVKPVEWSEDDEKIKKAISYAIAQCTHSDNTLIEGVTKEEALAYIDKQYSAKWSEEEKPIPQEEFDAAKRESLWKEQKPAEWKQGKQIEEGDKVKIHCREDRSKDMLSIYNDKVGEVISIWDAQGNPWGPIIVRLDNGCSNGFHEDELDIFDEPPILEKDY